ncbi:hypothetical protein RHMOL_Rhmol13G0281200 [Rhododendron molle]|uniref:Uncharacterized protein n=1 Tax=Rhododendron molle TaxID=49168 RepID=A0ACC0LC22_RHOML|nr:hypothetical protein RHMOL_Rhmol13G0281200 [Rhododendron molle]
MTKSEDEVIKGVSEEEQDSSDRLHTLPDEVLHLILSKITDPKTLLISSLISNRIASILSHSLSLSLQFPIPIPYPSTNRNPTSSNPPNTTTRSLLSCLTFPFRFLHQISAPKPPPQPSSEPNSADDDLFLRLIKLLRRFNGVRSLRIELPCSCRNSDEVEAGFSTVFKWKAKFGLRFEIFSFLSPKSVTKIEDDLEEDDDEEEVDGDYLIEHTHYEFYGPVNRAISSHRLMLLLLARHPNLRSVEIVESAKHGGLKLEGEELIRVRNALDSTPEAWGPPRFRFPWRLKIWYVPRMELSSGFVMKKVTLVVCRGKGVGANRSGEGEVDDNGDALDGGFEGDGDGIFGEALAEILTKHRFKARCYPIGEDEDACLNFPRTITIMNPGATGVLGVIPVEIGIPKETPFMPRNPAWDLNLSKLLNPGCGRAEQDFDEATRLVVHSQF